MQNGKLAEQGSYVPKGQANLTASAHGRPRIKGRETGRRAGREDSPGEVPAAGGRCWWNGSVSHRGNGQAGGSGREVHTPVGRLAAAREDRVFEAEAALGVGGAVTVMEGDWGRGRRLGGPGGPPN